MKLPMALLLLLLLPLARATFVEFRRDLARSYASDGLFRSDVTDTVADVAWLQSYRRTDAIGATNGGFPPVACAEVTSESSSAANVVTVVVGISSCLSDATLAKIKDWVAAIAKTKPTCWRSDASAALKLKFVLHASPCAVGSNESALTRNKLSRLDGFKPFGSVAATLPSASDDVTAAVMFFADDGSGPLKDLSAYRTLTDYEEKAKVPLAYNFQVNELATPSPPVANAKYLSSISELAKLALFTPVTRYACAAKLPNSKPVPFLDATGAKQCICTCPSGYEMAQASGKLSCQQISSTVSDAACGTCIWDVFGPLKFEVTEALKTCELAPLLAASGMPMPFLMTVNVNEGRAVDASRQLTFAATPQLSPVYNGDDIASFLFAQQKLSGGKFDRDALLLRRPLQLPRAYSGPPKYTPTGGATKTSASGWSQYQAAPLASFSKLPFAGFGKYKLSATAADSSHRDSCTGCLTVVDQYRPSATTQCPAPFSDAGAAGSSSSSSSLPTAELTGASVARADASVQQVFAFQSNATNDACSASSRCDDELFELRDFFSAKFATGGGRFADARECFAPKRVWADFLGAAAAQQLLFADGRKLQADVPTSAQQCTRCCRVSVALKEKWVDYLCDATYDTERCDGRASEACAYTQCLTLSGRSALTADAQVRESVQTESVNVMNEIMRSDIMPSTAVHVPPAVIHRALQCTRFGEADDDSCRFRSTVSALVSTTAAFHPDWSSYTSGKDAAGLVSWRYRVAGDPTWRLLSGASAVEHTFAQPESLVSLEAWSQCGLVRALTLYVILHVHSPERVCERFGAMWYQASVAPLKAVDTPLCNVPKSSFVELTFDNRPGFGAGAGAVVSLRSSMTRVVCSASLNARPSVEIVRVESPKSLDVVRRFAVQLQTLPSTAAATTLNVTCAFTFARYDKSTVTLACSKSFVLKDCDAPCASASPLDAACTAASALAACASKQQPGPYEACGSAVISATSTQTQLTLASDMCCQSCGVGVPTACVGVVTVPGDAINGSSAGLWRCEPRPPGLASNAYAFASAVSAHVAATSPALVAAVAVALGLVATRRRQRAQQQQRARAAEQAELVELLAS